MRACTFFGHRDCPETIKSALHSVIELLIAEGVTTFYVGNHGQFDTYVRGALGKLKKKYPHVDYAELEMLSKLIEIEAGSRWLPMEWKMAEGEVVLNRIASPEFPNSMREVIEQPGQYYGRGSAMFASTLPSEDSAKAALRLLEGERVICDPGVVFQANFPLGSGAHTVLHDPQLGYTYLCYSENPELYLNG